MDIVLELSDQYFFDGFYNSCFGSSPFLEVNQNTTATAVSNSNKSLPIFPPNSNFITDLIQFNWSDRDDIVRQICSLYIVTLFGGLILYFVVATASFLLLYDKRQMQDPKFLRHQIPKEIFVTLLAAPIITALTVPWFLGEVRGYSRLYRNLSDHCWCYNMLTVLGFIAFTDMAIYWIHRALHSKLLYTRIHKLHHKWIVPTPFASHAFHPLDAYFQSIPYHIYVFLFPLNSILYLLLYILVNLWTVSIHDGVYAFPANHTNGEAGREAYSLWFYYYSKTFDFMRKSVNSSAHHTVHHRDFLYNYGQYFTLWDRLGGSFKEPSLAVYKHLLTNETTEEHAKASEKNKEDNKLKSKKFN